ncbi:MAG: thymidine kinase, partial [Thermoplasmata archaeon]
SEAEIPELLEKLALERRIVYASALNRDHFGNPFPVTSKLLGFADEIFTLTAVCAVCGGDAIFSQRMMGGHPAFGEIIKVGGKEMYEPRCRNCFVHPNEQKKLDLS